MVGPRNPGYAEESAEVEVLYANLGRLKTLTKKIQGSVARLEVSGQIVTEAIGPINNNIQQLQVTNRNIDRVNDAIERLRQPLDAKGREEGIIRAGPQSAGLPQYLGALKRIDRALADLNSSNLRANQQTIADFHALLSTGSSQLQELFRATLLEEFRPIEPLNYITKQLAFPVFSREKRSHLSQIAAAITSAAEVASPNELLETSAAASIYAEIRSPYLTASLQNLATASINTSRRKSTDNEIYRLGTSGVGAYASGIEGMLLAEHENVSQIFDGEESGRVLEMTCRGALDEFAKVLKELDGFVKSRILSDCFLAFEIVDLVSPMSFRLDSRTGHLKAQIQDALRPIWDTARFSLTELLTQTSIKCSSINALPSDGNTVHIVSETMSRMSALSLYPAPISSLLASIGDGKWRSSSQPGPIISTSSASTSPDPSSPDLLGHYLSDILETLLSSLDAKSKSLPRAKYLQGIFLCNTIAIVDRVIRSSSALSHHLTPASSSPTTKLLDSFRKRGSSLYADGWRETSTHLLDTVYTSRTRDQSVGTGVRPISGPGATDSSSIIKGLANKDRERIREKFKAFNVGFDEMVARHRSLHMEREVRASMAREVQAMIEPLYTRFWDRYHSVEKEGKGKVVKYDKASMAASLIGLA